MDDTARTDTDDFYTLRKLKIHWQAWLNIQEEARSARRDPYEHAAIMLERVALRPIRRRKAGVQAA